MKARLHLLSTVSAVAVAGNAFAADLPVKAPPPVAVVAPSWTGFYLGGHGGIAWLRHEQRITGTLGIATCTLVAGATCGLRDTGAVLGAQAGYNWQHQQLVFGIETDVSWTSLKKTVTFFPAGVSTFSHSLHDKVDWLASVRGRLGYTTGDILFYATGGVAFANVNAGHFRTGDFRDQIDKTLTGWVAGGGIEKAFSRNWSARAEFLHYGFGKTTQTVPFFVTRTYTTAFRHDVSVVRLGINFRP